MTSGLNRILKYRIKIILENQNDVCITWPFEYESSIIASRMLGEVASQLIRIGIVKFKLKVV
jgi:hypothetical protein